MGSDAHVTSSKDSIIIPCFLGKLQLLHTDRGYRYALEAVSIEGEVAVCPDELAWSAYILALRSDRSHKPLPVFSSKGTMQANIAILGDAVDGSLNTPREQAESYLASIAGSVEDAAGLGWRIRDDVDEIAITVAAPGAPDGFLIASLPFSALGSERETLLYRGAIHSQKRPRIYYIEDFFLDVPTRARLVRRASDVLALASDNTPAVAVMGALTDEVMEQIARLGLTELDVTYAAGPTHEKEARADAKCLAEFTYTSDRGDRRPVFSVWLHQWPASAGAGYTVTETWRKVNRDSAAFARALERLSVKEVLSPRQATITSVGGEDLSDLGNALRLIRRHKDELVYVEPRRGDGDWYSWDQSRERWMLGEGAVSRLAQCTVLAMKDEAVALAHDQKQALMKWALMSQSGPRLREMVRIARWQTEILGSREQFDADAFVLGVENGVIDLRTGAHRPGRREDKITHNNGIQFDPKATCPRWEQFMLEVMMGNAEMVSYLQRAVGYSLTGSREEEAVFFLLGTGGNGKGIFAHILRKLVGDDEGAGYGYASAFDTWLVNSKEIRNDIAATAGKRVITASEPSDRKEGKVVLDLGRIKEFSSITDKQNARFLRQENFQFTPRGKLWFLMNNRPEVNDPSNGMWRRIKEVVFPASFDGSKDTTLPQQLEAELPGILNWAIRGCLEWQQLRAQGKGLSEPQRVINSTRNYRREADVVHAFLEDACETGSGLEIPVDELYEDYVAYQFEECKHEIGLSKAQLLDGKVEALRAAGKIETKNAFMRKLTIKGYAQRRDTSGAKTSWRVGLTTHARLERLRRAAG